MKTNLILENFISNIKPLELIENKYHHLFNISNKFTVRIINPSNENKNNKNNSDEDYDNEYYEEDDIKIPKDKFIEINDTWLEFKNYNITLNECKKINFTGGLELYLFESI